MGNIKFAARIGLLFDDVFTVSLIFEQKESGTVT